MNFNLSFLYLCASLSSISCSLISAFVPVQPKVCIQNSTALFSKRPTDQSQNEKFSSAQRFESIKSGVVGLFSGGFAMLPFTALHDLAFPLSGMNSLAQFEYDNDSGSLEAALFAIVYRYCVREGEREENDMLAMGVISAFVAVRTLSRLRIPTYCSAIPLDCGDPLGYFDWELLGQLSLNGLESAALFGATAAAMEYSYSRGIIKRCQ